MRITAKTLVVIGKRQDVIPEICKDKIGDGQGWYIFNATRPLPGHFTWRGTFNHGVFYSAINPQLEMAEEWIEECVALDGWILSIQPEEIIREQVGLYYERKGLGVDVGKYNVYDLLPTYLRHIRKRDTTEIHL